MSVSQERIGELLQGMELRRPGISTNETIERSLNIFMNIHKGNSSKVDTYKLDTSSKLEEVHKGARLEATHKNESSRFDKIEVELFDLPDIDGPTTILKSPKDNLKITNISTRKVSNG